MGVGTALKNLIGDSIFFKGQEPNYKCIIIKLLRSI